MRKVLTFDDVALVPLFNDISSRLDPSLETWFTKNIKINLCLIPANMDSVIGVKLANIISEYGGIPIFHRFAKFDTIKSWIKDYNYDFALSCGIGKDDKNELLDNIFEWAKEFKKLRCIVIDVAHGHSEMMLKTINKIKKTTPALSVVAGNICTAEATENLINAGADGIKVGVGGGSPCITRTTTGFGVSNFSAIQDCAAIANKYNIPIIADGGIRNTADVAKALAAGASTVMMGKIFALTAESAALKRDNYDNTYEIKYRGQASADFQEDFFGTVKKGTVPEGEASWIKVTNLQSAKEVIEHYLGALRSSMTYAGARTIKEFQQKAQFVRVTEGYKTESGTRLY